MSRAQGHLTAFTIALIFVMVFVGMFQAWEYSQDPDLPQDPAEAVERDARAAVWERVNQFRAENARYQAPRTDRVEIAAQETAEILASGDGLTRAIASGTGIQGDPMLPNPGPRCTQLAVPVDLPADHLAADGSSLSTAAAERLATRSLAGFRSVDDIGTLERRAWANNGIGVAIDGTEAQVVYRSCMTRRYSP